MGAFLVTHGQHTILVTTIKQQEALAKAEIYDSLGSRLEENSVPGFLVVLSGGDTVTTSQKLEVVLRHLMVGRLQDVVGQVDAPGYVLSVKVEPCGCRCQ